MRNTLSQTLDGIRKSLAGTTDKLLFAAIACVIFVLFVMLPVWTTPGNDLAFQLALFTPGVYALMASLSILNALVISMQVHIRREQKAKIGAGQVGSGLGAVGVSLIATIGCAACYSSVLALFGLAGTVFIVEHRAWFATAAVALASFAIYHSGRKIAGGCNVCRIDN